MYKSFPGTSATQCFCSNFFFQNIYGRYGIFVRRIWHFSWSISEWITSLVRNKGALTENYVSSSLVSNGYTTYNWESEGKAEIDFSIQTQKGEVIPVEVKSAENVRSKSLHQFISRYTPQFSIRISAKNFDFENKIKSVPLYAVFCIDFLSTWQFFIYLIFNILC